MKKDPALTTTTTYLILGPTGVGKSDFALALAADIGGEIINCDVGQFYVPLTIGTAKPAWKEEVIPHHLFDILAEPVDYTVVAYRQAVAKLIKEIRGRGKTPVIVGGSLFYALGLFFPPCAAVTVPAQEPRLYEGTTEELWEQLAVIDAERARALHRNDRYRIERALSIWETTGTLPSRCKPQYDPVMEDWHILYLTRDRAELYRRIDLRTKQMIQKEGWKEEVATLGAQWHPFVRKKGLLGYGEILDALDKQPIPEEALIGMIQQETRHYAKRQETFWRSMARKLQEQDAGGEISVVNLTFLDVNLYIRQLHTQRLCHKNT